MSTRKRGLDSNSASPKISQYFTPMDSETDMELTANETQNEGEIGDESCGQAYDELSQSSPEAPGADSTDHTEKKRKTNGNNHDKASTDRDLLLTLINKIYEMNTNLTSRLDTALNKIEMNRKDIENVKDKQEASQFDTREFSIGRERRHVTPCLSSAPSSTIERVSNSMSSTSVSTTQQ